MANTKLRVGMIGAGGIASGVHANGWMDHPNVEVVAVCDIDEARAKRLAEKVGAQKVFTDFNELVNLDEVDAVDICTPNKIHTPAVLAALNAGKHAVCEKPLAVTVDEVLQMGRLADEKKLKLMTAQHMRYSGAGVACKQFMGEEGVGTPYHARVFAVRRNLLPTAPGFIDEKLSGGGPCMDIGVHALDLTMWLMGFPKPVRVSGTSKVNFAKGNTIPGAWGEWDRDRYSVEDFAAGFVHFEGGATMALEACWIAHKEDGEQMRGEVFGDKGSIAWPAGIYYSTKNRVMYDAQLKPPPGLKKPHTAELHDFYDCVVNDTPSPVPYTETVKVIAILEGIYRSQTEGREVEMKI
jgi:predicted dehydrogenase